MELVLGKKKYTVDVITARKLKQTLAFKKKFEILQAQETDEERLIDEMLSYIVNIYSFKKGEEVVKQFTEDDILDNLPLSELNKVFNETVESVLAVFTEKN